MAEEKTLKGAIHIKYEDKIYKFYPNTDLEQVEGYEKDILSKLESRTIYKTATEWEAASDTVIPNAYMAYDTTNDRVKFGDGKSTYAELSDLESDTIDAKDINGIYEAVRNILYPITIPTVSGDNVFVYDGTPKTVELNDYDDTKVKIVSGSLSAINAGNHEVTIGLKIDGSQWVDGSNGNKTFTYTIERATISEPTAANDLVYNGNPQNLVNGFDSNTMTVTTGKLQETNVNTYTIGITPDSNHKWETNDSTDEVVYNNIAIGRAVVTSNPVQNGTITYNGTEQEVSWSGLDTKQLVIGGETKGTNAGTYTATKTPTNNYKFDDNSVGPKDLSWKIDKATGEFNVSTDTIILDATTTSDTFVVSITGDGTVSATSNSNTVATVSQNANTFTVKGIAAGDTTITVTVTDGDNYTYTNRSINVNVSVSQIAPTNLNDASWDLIASLIKDGKFGLYYSVGNYKEVTFKSANVVTGSDITAVSGTYRAVVIGIDHDSEVEGSNRVHFAIIKNTDDVQVAICDTKLNSITGNYLDYGSTEGFIMNLPNENDEGTSGGNKTGCNLGGWKSSYGRRKVAQGFYDNIFPDDLKSKISKSIKWTDNVAGGTNEETNLSATEDYVWFLAEFEIFGARTYANSYEQNKQSQYEYFKNGSKVCYKNGSTATAVRWWVRSPHYDNVSYFCESSAGGTANYDCSSDLLGVVPCFTIA